MKVITIVLLFVVMVVNLALGSSIKSPSTQSGEITPQLHFVAHVDGKSFVVDMQRFLNWTQASDLCTSMGMKLATITSPKQYKALNEARVGEFAYGYGFWTAGRDLHNIKQFKWNTTNTDLSTEFLPLREAEIQYQTCVGFSKSTTNNSALFAQQCSKTYGTLCET